MDVFETKYVIIGLTMHLELFLPFDQNSDYQVQVLNKE